MRNVRIDCGLGFWSISSEEEIVIMLSWYFGFGLDVLGRFMVCVVFVLFVLYGGKLSTRVKSLVCNTLNTASIPPKRIC